MEAEADKEVLPVEELPMIKGLEETPTAKGRLMQIAEANGWIQNIGGVPTISRGQMRAAQEIISNDLKLHKEINELALGDVTQSIVGLKQSLLDPKLKDEDRANVQAQIDAAVQKQGIYLNAVNMADRKIQQELAMREPGKPATPKQPTTVTLEVNKSGTPTPGVTHVWTQDPVTGERKSYVGQAKTDKSGKPSAGGGVKRTSADIKEANKSVLENVLAGTDIEVKEIFNDATGTVNAAILRQKLKAEGFEERYRNYTKLKQLSQRNLRDTEMTIEDSVVQAFRDAKLEHLLGETATLDEGKLPRGATKGKELVEYAPGEKGYPVYDSKGVLIGHDRVR
jgi:hypothetical protein